MNHRQRLGAEFGGDGNKISQAKFSNDLFGEKFPFLPLKFLMTFFLVIDRILSVFY